MKNTKSKACRERSTFRKFREVQNATTRKTEKTTQKTTQKILEVLKDNPTATRKELADLLGLTPDGIKWNIEKLKKEGKLRRIGPDKGGKWEVIEE